ncbi:hypothetical protein EAH_00058230 [Eimeria acervulina]|uniref:Uncharacterized protein n=1 Tax=Eimeria acervulina TaxID=5801 RepID=U6GDU9_EIMAC|nr:hypothetical protein EAH_00058230 [Eimeria acervulina]CDI76749.1 hypothetical protein EAH_00058230 [Eimeria acervulina]
MDVPKVALVLLSPATDVYFRLLQMRPTLTLREHPYSILINASKDSVIPLDDSIRLVETADIGSCRLEVVDDDHTFNSLTSEDFKGWVEEAYQKGAEAAEKDAAEGGKKHFDVSLFVANSAAAEESNQQQQTTEV